MPHRTVMSTMNLSGFTIRASDLLDLLELTRDALRKVRKNELDRYRIHPRRYALLLVLKDLGDWATPGEIAQRLLRKRHTVSELLGKMKRDGLVENRRDELKRNRVRVLLTDDGRRVIELASRRESIHRMMSCITQEERQDLKSLLETLRDQALKELEAERAVPVISYDDEDYGLYLQLIETTNEVQKARQKELNRFGIHHRRSAVMLALQDAVTRPTAEELAQRLVRERHSISELLSKMEREGLVRKMKDVERTNVVRFELAEEGRKAINESGRGKLARRLLYPLTIEERNRLRSHLGTLFRASFEELSLKRKRLLGP